MRYLSLFLLAFMSVAFIGCGGSGIKNGTTASADRDNDPRRARSREAMEESRKNSAEKTDDKKQGLNKDDQAADESKADKTEDVAKADDSKSADEEGLSEEDIKKRKMTESMLADMDPDSKMAQMLNRSKNNKKDKDKEPLGGGRGMVIDINNLPAGIKEKNDQKNAERAKERQQANNSSPAGRGNRPAFDGDSGEAETVETKISVDSNGSYLEAAKNSFKLRSEDDAFRYMYAHALTADDAFSEYPMSWVASLKEPRLAVRWGVAIVYSAPSDFEGKPPVIGDPEAEKTSSNSRGGRGGSGRGGARGGSAPSPLGGGGSGTGGRGGSDNTQTESPYANVDPSTPNGAVLYYTGDFGERLLKRLEMRRERSFYGKFLSDMPAIETENAAAEDAPQRQQRSAAQGGANKRNLLSQGPPANLGSRSGQGNRAASTDNSSFDIADIEVGTIQPGIMLIGHGTGKASEKDLINKAADLGIDFLVCIHVDVESRSNQGPFSKTFASIINVKDPTESRKKCATLNNETVFKARESQKDESKDKVEMALDRLFADFADKEGFRTAEMLKLPEDAVISRVNKISEIQTDNPMPIMLEIVYYFSEGLAPETSAVTALGKFVGEEKAATLLTGSEKEKRKVVKQWLPAGSGSSDSDSDSDSGDFR